VFDRQAASKGEPGWAWKSAVNSGSGKRPEKLRNIFGRNVEKVLTKSSNVFIIYKDDT
jgi:mRNA-degrading endonuclease HigB of HigAB toxin-antitoxin module